MRYQTLQILTIGVSLASFAFAQNSQRQAAITGGGGPDRGKCTLEVVVDSVVQVEIRGTTANLHTISGQPAQWRRFECTGAMPVNPPNFQFAGVDGRGKQTLVRSPQSGGTAVVEIEDKDGGSEGYTFDLTWGNGGPGGDRGYPSMDSRQAGGPPAGGQPPSGNRPPDNRGYDNRAGDNRYPTEEYRPNYRESDYYRRYGHGFATEDAIRICQQSATTQATQRFRTNDVHVFRTRIEDRPGREDFVVGTLDVHRRNGEERYGFSCSVDFQSGQVRTVELDARPLPADPRYR